MEPCRIDLPRTYAMWDDVEDKKEDWGPRLWSLISFAIDFEPPVVLVDREAYGFVRDRMISYIHARLVTRARQIDLEMATFPEDARQDRLAEMVEEVLSLGEQQRQEIAWLLSRISARIRRKGAVLTTPQRRGVEDFASGNGHRCYICGRALHYADLPHPEADIENANYRSFELDHMFPQKRGGSRSRANLAACCESCNKFKDVKLSFADEAVEAFITASMDIEKVARAFHARARFLVLWRQKGECARCSIKLYDAPDERLFLFRKNQGDAYHFLNVEIGCGTCGDLHAGAEEEGIKIRD